MSNTTIEWTDFTWSPIRARIRFDASAIAAAKGYTSLVQIADKITERVKAGKHSGFGHHCEHASPGCNNCYAESNAGRCLPGNGLGLPFDRRSRDLTEIVCDVKELLRPLSWKTPRRIFVENQSDLFGEWISDEEIDRVVVAMALANWHTYQILTKRAGRMRKYWSSVETMARVSDLFLSMFGEAARITIGRKDDGLPGFSLSNVQLGVSVESQKYADERVEELRATPAALRFISQEPQIEDIRYKSLDGVGWVIVGGESGHGARPFDIAWARQTIAQCTAAGVPVFVKQLGRNVAPVDFDACGIDTYLWAAARAGISDGEALDSEKPIEVGLEDPKGADMSEWPECVQVREFPE